MADTHKLSCLSSTVASDSGDGQNIACTECTEKACCCDKTENVYRCDNQIDNRVCTPSEINDKTVENVCASHHHNELENSANWQTQSSECNLLPAKVSTCNQNSTDSLTSATSSCFRDSTVENLSTCEIDDLAQPIDNDGADVAGVVTATDDSVLLDPQLRNRKQKQTLLSTSSDVKASNHMSHYGTGPQDYWYHSSKRVFLVSLWTNCFCANAIHIFNIYDIF